LQGGNLARVEGEGSVTVNIRAGAVNDVRLEIFEPPRFFEAFLRGRRHTEPPDITSRVCGICPVAYQMSACRAIESVCGVTVDGPLRDLRRVLYCGEWIESHALHIYLLHAPDFLGYDGAIELARDHRDLVERGLRLKKAGNRILEVLGGRAVHPINVRLGGFWRLPSDEELSDLTEVLHRALDDARATVRWVAGFDFPDFTHAPEYLALDQEGTYPLEGGDQVVTSSGLRFPVSEFGSYVTEEHVAHSTALHARLHGHNTYLTGPLARYALHHDLLSPSARSAAKDAGLGATCTNPFQSIVVRAVEVVFACEEALKLLEHWERPAAPALEVPPRAGLGHGATEAPRGLLYHRYELDAEGIVLSASLIPPTSQNLRVIEDDLRALVATRLDLDDHTLTHLCEQAVRNHDPCISCATHFLTLRRNEA
jgi:coenzyme F420-reducing hydrogenase alpha subunit